MNAMHVGRQAMTAPATRPTALVRWLGGIAEVMPGRATASDGGASRDAIFRIAVAIGVMTTIVGFGAWDPITVAVPTLLVGVWLGIGAGIHAVQLISARSRAALAAIPSIPLSFAGPTGRFALRRRDRARIQVVAGEALVAEIVANDQGDELVIYEMPDDDESGLIELGSAIGQAIDIAAANPPPELPSAPFGSRARVAAI
ncbi:MAG: hypothetical protein ACR2I5_11840 [Candidatus Limnocylindria bacterium]